MILLNLFLLFVALTAYGSSLPSESGGKTFTAGDVTYYSPQDVASQLHLDEQGSTLDSTAGIELATVITTNSTDISPEVLKSLIEQYETIDDVWSSDFLNTVIIVAPPSSSLQADSLTWLAGEGTKYLLPATGVQVPHASCGGPLPLPQQDIDLLAGPYLLQPGEDGAVTVHQVYRLYGDETMSFYQGVVSIPGSVSYAGIDVYDPKTTEIFIPVPSRLYSLADTRPLAGLRFAVKDLYDLQGTQTTGGSRVYEEVMPLADESAVSVTKLLELGAVPVVRQSLATIYTGH